MRLMIVLGLIAAAGAAAGDDVIATAEKLLDAEHFDEADAVLQDALVKQPAAANLQRVLGDLRYRQGRIFDAEKAYKAALHLDDHNARALYGLSRVYRATCLRKKAAEILQVAHAIDFHDARIAGGFFANDRRSPAAIARMDARLQGLRGASGGQEDKALEHALEKWIAEAKALDGKPEFDLRSPAPSYRIPLGHLMDGKRFTGVSLPVQINGVKADLRLDTGASGIVVSSRFAARAGIRRLADAEMSGIGNGADVKGWVGYAPTVEIGDVELANCLVDVPDKGAADDSGGLIGTDIFSRFLVKMNFKGATLDLDPLPGPAWDGHSLVDRYDGPELAGFTQIVISQHDLLVPTLISESTRKDQTAGLFLLDTGSTANLISTNLAPAVTKVHDSETRVRGVSGKVKMVYEADKVMLQFARFRQQNLDLTSFDLSAISRSTDMEVSGIMGLPLIGMFNAVTIDYRDGRVKFDYQP